MKLFEATSKSLAMVIVAGVTVFSLNSSAEAPIESPMCVVQPPAQQVENNQVSPDQYQEQIQEAQDQARKCTECKNGKNIADISCQGLRNRLDSAQSTLESSLSNVQSGEGDAHHMESLAVQFRRHLTTINSLNGSVQDCENKINSCRQKCQQFSTQNQCGDAGELKSKIASLKQEIEGYISQFEAGANSRTVDRPDSNDKNNPTIHGIRPVQMGEGQVPQVIFSRSPDVIVVPSASAHFGDGGRAADFGDRSLDRPSAGSTGGIGGVGYKSDFPESHLQSPSNLSAQGVDTDSGPSAGSDRPGMTADAPTNGSNNNNRPSARGPSTGGNTGSNTGSRSNASPTQQNSQAPSGTAARNTASGFPSLPAMNNSAAAAVAPVQYKPEGCALDPSSLECYCAGPGAKSAVCSRNAERSERIVGRASEVAAPTAGPVARMMDAVKNKTKKMLGQIFGNSMIAGGGGSGWGSNAGSARNLNPRDPAAPVAQPTNESLGRMSGNSQAKREATVRNKERKQKFVAGQMRAPSPEKLGNPWEGFVLPRLHASLRAVNGASDIGGAHTEIWSSVSRAYRVRWSTLLK